MKIVEVNSGEILKGFHYDAVTGVARTSGAAIEKAEQKLAEKFIPDLTNYLGD